MGLETRSLLATCKHLCTVGRFVYVSTNPPAFGAPIGGGVTPDEYRQWFVIIRLAVLVETPDLYPVCIESRSKNV